ncbi:MAG: hypothetical protein U1E78_09085 [Gammaproteobacteria bacterium]
MGNPLEESWKEFKNGIASLIQARLRDGFTSLTSAGGKFIHNNIDSLTQGMSLRNKELSIKDKIIPTLLFPIALTLTIISVLAVVTGLSTIVPFIVFAGSCGMMLRSVSEFVKEASALVNLNKKLISFDDLKKSLPKKYKSDVDVKENLNQYIDRPRQVIYALYELRNNILESSDLTVEEKNKALSEVKMAIEKFYNDQTLDLSQLNKNLPSLKDLLGNIAKLHANLELTKTAVDYLIKEKKISKGFMKKVERYKKTRESIYAQDLPRATKEKILELIDKKDISKDELKLVYASISNHQLSLTSFAQDRLYDNQLLIHCYKTIKKAGKGSLDDDKLNSIKNYLHPDLSKASTETIPGISDISDILNHNQDLIALVEEQRKLNVARRASEKGIQVDPVIVKIDYKKRDWGVKFYSLVKEKLGLNKNERPIQKGQEGEQRQHYLDYIRESIKDDQRHIKHLYRETNHNSKDILKKAAYRNYLRSAVPRDAMNIVLSLGVVAISGVTSIILPLLAAPGGQVVLIANLVLGAVTGALVVGSLGNSIALGAKERKMRSKMDGMHQKAQSILTKPSFNKSKKEKKLELDSPSALVQKQKTMTWSEMTPTRTKSTVTNDEVTENPVKIGGNRIEK